MARKFIVLAAFIWAGHAGSEPSCEEKVGQMIITTPPPEPHANIGGISYFGDYMDKLGSVDKIRETAERHRTGGKYPRFVAFDNEGGKVQRLKKKYGFKEAAKAPIDISSAEEARRAGRITGGNVDKVSGNMNFGTVLDLCRDGNPIIHKFGRCFSTDPDRVSKYGLQHALGNSYYDVIPTIKHAPGHGSTTSDTHLSLAPVDKTLAELEQSDLKPFRELVSKFSEADFRQQQEAGRSHPVRRQVAVMMGHMTFPKIPEWGDAPASLNPKIVSVIRKALGSDGLIISDDIGIMDAVRKDNSLIEATTKAIAAGNDVVILGNSRNRDGKWEHFVNFKTAEEQGAFLNQLCQNKQLRPKIDASFKRILKNKQDYGIMTAAVPTQKDHVKPAETDAVDEFNLDEWTANPTAPDTTDTTE